MPTVICPVWANKMIAIMKYVCVHFYEMHGICARTLFVCFHDLSALLHKGGCVS